MTSATALSPTASAEQRLLLYSVPWETYDQLLHTFEGRRLRLTYDQGTLEIMTVSPKHEWGKTLLARLVETLTLELDIPILGLGTTTWRRQDLERGLEPDECWYIQHEAQMRGRDTIDLTVDPPPDLVVEMEVSRSVLDRIAIYARLGVPEVWRFDGVDLRFLVLTPEGRYEQVARSQSLPKVASSDLTPFLRRQGQVDETQLVKSFRQWVREHILVERDD